jgi:hypothetical protein
MGTDQAPCGHGMGQMPHDTGHNACKMSALSGMACLACWISKALKLGYSVPLSSHHPQPSLTCPPVSLVSLPCSRSISNSSWPLDTWSRLRTPAAAELAAAVSDAVPPTTVAPVAVPDALLLPPMVTRVTLVACCGLLGPDPAADDTEPASDAVLTLHSSPVQPLIVTCAGRWDRFTASLGVVALLVSSACARTVTVV